MKILAVLVNYFCCDRLDSECSRNQAIITNLTQKGHKVMAMVGINESDQPLPAKVKLYPVFKKKSQNALSKAFFKSEDY